MIYRTYDVADIRKTMDPYAHEIYGFVPEDWLANSDNICLTDGHGNFSLFERELPYLVSGHLFFKESKGKDAVILAKQMLEEVFTGPYSIRIVRGLTPLQKLGARWVAKKIGFVSHGVVQTIVGPCELFILSHDEWSSKRNNL